MKKIYANLHAKVLALQDFKMQSISATRFETKKQKSKSHSKQTDQCTHQSVG